MEPSLLFLLAGIAGLGFLSHWLAWELRIPSIVFLFLGGLLAGPLTGFLSPDALFGKLLFPTVSALIGIILFEGGLTLRFEDLEELHLPVFRVIVFGGFITFLLASLAAFQILNFPVSLSFLLGATMVVTGPTVVIPLLHLIRPEGDVGSLARWEGIIIDPLGAILTVIVFEIILAGTTGTAQGFGLGVLKFAEAIFVGTAVGLLSGYLLVELFDRYWIPDYLHNFAIIATVLVSQSTANFIAHEAGLLTVTVMGMFMANQNRMSIRHVMDFKEELRVLFISALFIILVARLEFTFLSGVGFRELLFLTALILVVRPVAILISTLGTNLTWAERGFLSWIAPRGIVAAAVASLFAAELEHLGVPRAGQLDDVTFLVIAGTVTVYGLTLSPLSRWMGISDELPQGVLIVGAHRWARALGQVLREQGVRVSMVDKNPDNVMRAKQGGLNAICVDVVTETEFQTVNIQGIGYCLALTNNEEVNTLAALHAHDMGFDRAEIFQIAMVNEEDDEDQEPDPFQGRFLFDQKMSFQDVQKRFNKGWRVNCRELEDEADVSEVESRIPDSLLPVIRLRDPGKVTVLTDLQDLDLKPGDRLVALRETSLDEDRERL